MIAAKQRFFRVFHNVVAHPLIEILPEKWGVLLHDWSAAKAWHK